jgi:hypothetical protein
MSTARRTVPLPPNHAAIRLLMLNLLQIEPLST